MITIAQFLKEGKITPQEALRLSAEDVKCECGKWECRGIIEEFGKCGDCRNEEDFEADQTEESDRQSYQDAISIGTE